MSNPEPKAGEVPAQPFRDLERLPRRDPFTPGQAMEVWPEAVLQKLRENQGVPLSTIIGPLPELKWRSRPLTPEQ